MIRRGLTRPALSPPHLITGERCLNSKLKSEREDAKSKKAEEACGNQDVDADVGQEKEVGKDEDADNSSQTAQLGDLDNFASSLEKEYLVKSCSKANQTCARIPKRTVPAAPTRMTIVHARPANSSL